MAPKMPVKRIVVIQKPKKKTMNKSRWGPDSHVNSDKDPFDPDKPSFLGLFQSIWLGIQDLPSELVNPKKKGKKH